MSLHTSQLLRAALLIYRVDCDMGFLNTCQCDCQYLSDTGADASPCSLVAACMRGKRLRDNLVLCNAAAQERSTAHIRK